MSIKLSFCIPTYNRGKYIGETIESIILQTRDEVEIVIVDGASTDNTSEVVVSFQKRFPNLIYHRGIRNMGVDRDMATAVELARGEYCWLMSSDDLVKPGAISRMLEEITSGGDIYLCDVTLCDHYLRPIRNTNYLSKHRVTDRFDLTDRAQLLTYLGLATSNNALFCYISPIVFRRERWINVGYSDRFNGTCYAHVFMLFSFIKTRCLIRYIPSPLIINRFGNDCFSSQGLEKRYMLDFNGYLLLADQLFNEDRHVRRAFLQVMTREHPWYRILKLRSAIRFPKRWGEISTMLLEFGYNHRTLALCNIFGRFLFIVNTAVYLKRIFDRSNPMRWLR